MSSAKPHNGVDELVPDDDLCSADYVVVGSEEELAEPLMDPTSIDFKAYASQLQQSNEDILAKLRDENQQLKSLLEVNVRKTRKYFSDFKEYKLRMEDKTKQNGEEIARLKEQLDKQVQTSKLIEEQYKQAIQNMLNSGSSSVIGPSMVVVSDVEQMSTEELKTALKSDIENLDACKWSGAACLLPVTWLDKHRAHINADFSDETKPEPINYTGQLLDENGAIKQNLEESKDFVVISKAMYDHLAEFYSLKIQPLQYDMQRIRPLNYTVDIPSASANTAATAEAASSIGDSLGPQIDANVFDELQKHVEDLSDAKKNLQYHFDLFSADAAEERQRHAKEVEALNATIVDLQRENKKLLDTMKGQEEDQPKFVCPICDAVFPTHDGVRVHADACAEKQARAMAMQRN